MVIVVNGTIVLVEMAENVQNVSFLTAKPLLSAFARHSGKAIFVKVCLITYVSKFLLV